MIVLIFIRNVSNIHLTNGWKILEIGRFQDNYGGVIKFRRYHKETGEIYVGEEAPTDIENWQQDEDVLDTWFSSALWLFCVRLA